MGTDTLFMNVDVAGDRESAEARGRVRAEEIRASFNADEQQAHRLLRGMLWAMYPRPETLESSEEEDDLSDRSACFLIEGVRAFGILVQKASSS